MRQVTVMVYQGNSDNHPPINLLEFQRWVAERVKEIPVEFRGNAEIEIMAGESWGSPRVEIEITYRRPENAQEIAEREAAERSAQ